MMKDEAAINQTTRHPSWCCQSCGQQIGWIGRMFQWLLGCKGLYCTGRWHD